MMNAVAFSPTAAQSHASEPDSRQVVSSRCFVADAAGVGKPTLDVVPRHAVLARQKRDLGGDAWAEIAGVDVPLWSSYRSLRRSTGERWAIGVGLKLRSHLLVTGDEATELALYTRERLPSCASGLGQVLYCDVTRPTLSTES